MTETARPFADPAADRLGRATAESAAAEPRTWEPPAWPADDFTPWKDKFRRRNLAWRARMLARRRPA